MRTMIVVLIFITLLYSSTQALDCSSNPCDLAGAWSPKRGYNCFDLATTPPSVLCTCPGNGFEINQPCRLCDRSVSANNVCNNNAPNYYGCIEDITYKTGYACICADPSGKAVPTSDYNCDIRYPLTPVTSTAPSCKAGPSNPCSNGADFVSGKCECPSGYTGPTCQIKSDPSVCERINCKNSGKAFIRRPNGPYECVCQCVSGTWGEYCELTGTSGFCSASLCLNSGVCKENLIATTRFAYCDCQPGYNGTRCDTRYFTCKSAGLFPDELMKDQGKYFECKTVGTSLQAVRQSCGKGLLFDTTSKCCVQH